MKQTGRYAPAQSIPPRLGHLAHKTSLERVEAIDADVRGSGDSAGQRVLATIQAFH